MTNFSEESRWHQSPDVRTYFPYATEWDFLYLGCMRLLETLLNLLSPSLWRTVPDKLNILLKAGDTLQKKNFPTRSHGLLNVEIAY